MNSIEPNLGEVNWDHVDKLFEYGVQSCMKVDPKEMPVMMADNHCGLCSKIQEEYKEKIAELLFEKHSSPAMFAAPSGMLSGFSAGRPTTLVIDLGARETRIIPVVDGFVLRNAVLTTNRGGNWLDKKVLEEVVKSTGQPKLWFEKTDSGPLVDVTESFRRIHTMDIIKDIKKWMCFVPRNPLSPELLEQMRMPAYELPDGTSVDPKVEICASPEALFINTKIGNPIVKLEDGGSSESVNDSSVKIVLPGFNPDFPAHLQISEIKRDEDTLQDMILAAISKCDIDVRKDLVGNMVIVGGGSAVDGLINRITKEMTSMLPLSFKVKPVSQLPVERQYASWIGGSILGICGSFQQLWLSRAEYEEYGPSLVRKKFTH